MADIMIIKITGFKSGRLRPLFSRTVKITPFMMKPAINRYLMRKDWDRIVITRENHESES